MNFFFWFLIGAHVLVCLFLVLLVLIQNDKGGGLGGAFGGAGGGSFGAGGAATFVSKLTTYVAIGFMVIVLVIDYTVAKKDNSQAGSMLKEKVLEEKQGLGSLIPQESPVVIDTAATK